MTIEEHSQRRRVIAVDFDGVLCEDKWPEIGPEKKDIIELAKYRKQAGAALILWTCRCGEQLDEAVAWCRERGLEFDAVNENLPERVAFYGTESRKISADEYWDDKARGLFGLMYDSGFLFGTGKREEIGALSNAEELRTAMEDIDETDQYKRRGE